ncbi:hypothetical protein [Nitrincola sp. MINF-07-Sa-05]|uniref:hypothetical protein n=1 Tax=Nitrincola salilacus TaxID=3400273 RepID=UPI003917F124
MASRFLALWLLVLYWLASPVHAYVYPGSYTINLVLNDGRYRFPVIYQLEIDRTQQVQGSVEYPTLRCRAMVPVQSINAPNTTLQEQLEGQRPFCVARSVQLTFAVGSLQPEKPEYLTLVPPSGEKIAAVEHYEFIPSSLGAFLLAHQLTHPEQINVGTPGLALEFIADFGQSDPLARSLLDALFHAAQQKVDIISDWQLQLVREYPEHAAHGVLLGRLFAAHKEGSYVQLLQFSQQMGDFLDLSIVEKELGRLSLGLPALTEYEVGRTAELQGQRYYADEQQLVLHLHNVEDIASSYWRLHVPHGLHEELQHYLDNPMLNLAQVLPDLMDPASFVEQQYFARISAEDRAELWRAFLQRYPDSIQRDIAESAIARLNRQARADQERLAVEAQARAEARAAAAARREQQVQKRQAAYRASKHVGQEVCRDFTLFFSSSEIKGFVEQVVNHRLQIRIHYNGGSTLTNYREQNIYWEDSSNWRACRY